MSGFLGGWGGFFGCGSGFFGWSGLFGGGFGFGGGEAVDPVHEVEPVVAAFGADVVDFLEESAAVEVFHLIDTEGAEFDEGSAEVDGSGFH